MKCQGRCSASQAIVIATTLLLLIQFETAQVATFSVGDILGWTYDMQSWTSGKKFKAAFNYDPSLHNVAVVDVNGYNSCAATSNSRTYTSGKDRVRPSKGRNYFICTIPGHCDGGLKISVDAS